MRFWQSFGKVLSSFDLWYSFPFPIWSGIFFQGWKTDRSSGMFSHPDHGPVLLLSCYGFRIPRFGLFSAWNRKEWFPVHLSASLPVWLFLWLSDRAKIKNMRIWFPRVWSALRIQLRNVLQINAMICGHFIIRPASVHLRVFLWPPLIGFRDPARAGY